jgi:hypothetical protein
MRLNRGSPEKFVQESSDEAECDRASETSSGDSSGSCNSSSTSTESNTKDDNTEMTTRVCDASIAIPTELRTSLCFDGRMRLVDLPEVSARPLFVQRDPRNVRDRGIIHISNICAASLPEIAQRVSNAGWLLEASSTQCSLASLVFTMCEVKNVVPFPRQHFARIQSDVQQSARDTSAQCQQSARDTSANVRIFRQARRQQPGSILSHSNRAHGTRVPLLQVATIIRPSEYPATLSRVSSRQYAYDHIFMHLPPCVCAEWVTTHSALKNKASADKETRGTWVTGISAGSRSECSTKSHRLLRCTVDSANVSVCEVPTCEWLREFRSTLYLLHDVLSTDECTVLRQLGFPGAFEQSDKQAMCDLWNSDESPLHVGLLPHHHVTTSSATSHKNSQLRRPGYIHIQMIVDCYEFLCREVSACDAVTELHVPDQFLYNLINMLSRCILALDTDSVLRVSAAWTAQGLPDRQSHSEFWRDLPNSSPMHDKVFEIYSTFYGCLTGVVSVPCAVRQLMVRFCAPLPTAPEDIFSLGDIMDLDDELSDTLDYFGYKTRGAHRADQTPCAELCKDQTMYLNHLKTRQQAMYHDATDPDCVKRSRQYEDEIEAVKLRSKARVY